MPKTVSHLTTWAVSIKPICAGTSIRKTLHFCCKELNNTLANDSSRFVWKLTLTEEDPHEAGKVISSSEYSGVTTHTSEEIG